MRLNAGRYAGVCLVSVLLAICSEADPPKNVILFIGDGMGKEAIKAGGYFKGAPLAMQNGFPYTNTVTTYAADNPVTDSAAAATAIACGIKANNLVISLRLPGNGEDLETVLEIYKAAGKSTGLVTTRYLTDATPACFAAHTSTRYDNATIANDYLNVVRPNVLLGGGGYSMTVSGAQAAGFTVVTDRASMQAVNITNTSYLCGIFGTDQLPYEYDGLGSLPHLSEMTDTALAMMQKNTNGFFLMIEGGTIDIAAHGNDITRQVRETLEFDNCIAKGLLWASNRTDTLILVTADHECGGLTVLANNGASNTPTVSWSTTSHTATPVVALASGQRASDVSNVTDNTLFFPMILDVPVVIPSDYDSSNQLTTTANWHYFKGVSEPAGVANAWRSILYTNDSSWATGTMPFRYGDGSNGTLLSDMQTGYLTLYTRQYFVLTNAATIGSLKLGVDYDDAAIVWINGQQVFATTSAPVSTAYNTPAAASHESSLGSTNVVAETNTLTNVTYLVTGTNVIAIQGFNLGTNSSDFVLNANLYVQNYIMPPAGGNWTYFKGTNNPPGGTSAWTQVSYDESAWSTGGMPLHCGDGTGGVELTNMQTQYTTVFARRSFVVTNLTQAARLEFSVDYDDGFVLWLNGQELYQSNDPSNRNYQSVATLGHESSVGQGTSIDAVFNRVYTNAGLVQLGTNVIAVLGLNSGTNSSDFYLNVAMRPAPATNPDEDEDGMPDSWEKAFFGTTVISSGGSSDHDHDGFLDLHEYRAGTDPTNAGSALEIVDNGSTGQLPIITWQSASNRFYGVLLSTNLQSGWVLLAPTNLPGTPPVNVYTDSTTTNAIKFYRIRLND